MNILVTGAKGFVGRNLCEALKNVRDGKDKTRPNIHIEQIVEYDVDSAPEVLEEGTFDSRADIYSLLQEEDALKGSITGVFDGPFRKF